MAQLPKPKSSRKQAPGQSRPPPGHNPPISKLSVRLIFLSVPLLAISSFMLYKRIYLGEERRTRQGELREDGTARKWSSKERDAYKEGRL